MLKQEEERRFSMPSLTGLEQKSVTSNPFCHDRSKQMTSPIQISTNASKLVHQKISEQRWSVQKLLYITEYSYMLQCKIRKQLAPRPQNLRVRLLQFNLAAHIQDEELGKLSYSPPWSSRFSLTWVTFTRASPHHRAAVNEFKSFTMPLFIN